MFGELVWREQHQDKEYIKEKRRFARSCGKEGVDSKFLTLTVAILISVRSVRNKRGGEERYVMSESKGEKGGVVSESKGDGKVLCVQSERKKQNPLCQESKEKEKCIVSESKMR